MAGSPTSAEEFVRVCTLAELPEAEAVAAEVGGRTLAIVRTEDGVVHAVDDTCSHAAVSLSEGEVDGCEIECWLHGSAFDLTTGKPSALPATKPIGVYPVRIEGDQVFISPTPQNIPS
ncbi:non-heme iron oxygenase ferredoxin subunit [Dermacoccaceae bacterium W4C1]